ncbi:MAG: thioredoxin domain-containing protein [Pseudomonadota bacterium]|uniref:DsbA family protein n=1 Tax=Sphingomonas sp. ERG5 TaxID=1381597 RepID=UPI000691C3DF|nr:thioredoxin domain-containing protein [Sphingomonas sp. ERG5]
MIRWIIAVFLAPLLIGAAPAPRDWSKTVTQTSSGAFVIGNPKAKVKLIEYLSYTCPHCAHFSIGSSAVLKGKYVRSGSTSVELRHAIRDKLDMAATIIARCTGPVGFSATTDAVFAGQEDWLMRGIQFERVNGGRMDLYPENARLRALADGAGLTDIGRARGLNDAALDACFANDAEVLKIAVMADAAWTAIRAAAPADGGTPSFVVNGKPYPHLDWAGLDKVLLAAGAR